MSSFFYFFFAFSAFIFNNLHQSSHTVDWAFYLYYKQSWIARNRAAVLNYYAHPRAVRDVCPLADYRAPDGGNALTSAPGAVADTTCWMTSKEDKKIRARGLTFKSREIKKDRFHAFFNGVHFLPIFKFLRLLAAIHPQRREADGCGGKDFEEWGLHQLCLYLYFFI